MDANQIKKNYLTTAASSADFPFDTITPAAVLAKHSLVTIIDDVKGQAGPYLAELPTAVREGYFVSYVVVDDGGGSGFGAIVSAGALTWDVAAGTVYTFIYSGGTWACSLPAVAPAVAPTYPTFDNGGADAVITLTEDGTDQVVLVEGGSAGSNPQNVVIVPTPSEAPVGRTFTLNVTSANPLDLYDSVNQTTATATAGSPASLTVVEGTAGPTYILT